MKKLNDTKSKENKQKGIPFPVQPMEIGEMRLFPDEYNMGAASATECTGLVQVAPADEDVMGAYEEVYSYRQPKPIIKEE